MGAIVITTVSPSGAGVTPQHRFPATTATVLPFISSNVQEIDPEFFHRRSKTRPKSQSIYAQAERYQRLHCWCSSITSIPVGSPLSAEPSTLHARFCAKMTGHRFRNHAKRIGNKAGRFLQAAAWQTCKCVFWTVCSPCLCCIVLVLPNRTRRTPRVHIEAPKPMLPCPRRRALSIQSMRLQHYQKTLPQDRSPFMTKLPLEIRRMIYEKALGEVPIHLALADGKLNARRCSIGSCACYLQPLATKHTLCLALPLLRTCRRM